MTLRKSFIRNAATSPADARIMLMGLVVNNADGSPRTGVLGSADPSIVSALASMNVRVAAAEFVTSKGRADGVAIFGNDGAVNVPIDTAPASNSRIDVIYVKHNDDTTGDPNPDPVFGVAKGTAGASPAKPTIPTGALELATLRIYAGTTAANGGTNTLVNTYQMTAARGGIVAFRTKTGLNAWTTATPGQRAFVIDGGAEYMWNGTAWATPVAAGGVLGYVEKVGTTASIAAGGPFVALSGDASLATTIEVDKPTKVIISAAAYSSTQNMQIGCILSGATSHTPLVDANDLGIASVSTATSRLVITLNPGVTTITLGRRSAVASGSIRNPSILILAG